MKKACQITRRLILLCGFVGLLVTGFSSVAAADEEVDAGTIVVVSDDIMKRTANVERGNAMPDGGGDATADGGDGSDPTASTDDGTDGTGNDDNRSGLGDGTNPGTGDGTDNATNDGTDNPNRSGWGHWGRGRR
jgi:hypothetical protein